MLYSYLSNLGVCPVILFKIKSILPAVFYVINEKKNPPYPFLISCNKGFFFAIPTIKKVRVVTIQKIIEKIISAIHDYNQLIVF